MQLAEMKVAFLGKSGSIAVALVILVSTSLFLRPLEHALSNELEYPIKIDEISELDDALGQGVILGVLGGLRTLFADFAWLQLNQCWERQDRVGLNAYIQLATSLHPQSEYFWVNSARILAYDVSHWRIASKGGNELLGFEAQERIHAEQAFRGIELLHKALQHHPESATLRLEVGKIYLNRLKDYELATEWFARALNLKGVPDYAVRVYSDLLCKLGRQQEAYQFLTQEYLLLSEKNSVHAQILLERIDALEMNLNIPLGERLLAE